MSSRTVRLRESAIPCSLVHVMCVVCNIACIIAFEQRQVCAIAQSKAVLHGFRYSTCFVVKDLSISLSAAIASLHLG
jgi:hypothetical protein